MGAQLAATVFVRDPETRQMVELHPGTLPEPRLAALVTSRAAWVDGKLPRLPKTTPENPDVPQGPGGGPDGDSGAASTPDGPEQPALDDQAAPAAKKTAAKKTAATSRSRGRNAADTGGE
ncbi:hypothetical protein [Streptomyces sp. FxanaA7]|uniref:hypothetical protein n=1 Tax=Streptomyces sp. FxanaA7 TaxID=1265492 RepID=UPI0005EFF2C8|nr:hypothetical protein [Streptomyces sp. FxanaA7]